MTWRRSDLQVGDEIVSMVNYEEFLEEAYSTRIRPTPTSISTC